MAAADVVEVSKLAEVLAVEFGEAEMSDDLIWSASPAAKVIDCVLSLNRPYDSFCWPRVERFIEKHPSTASLGDLLDLMGQADSAGDFVRLELDYDHDDRAEALHQVLAKLYIEQRKRLGTTEEERLVAWATSVQPADHKQWAIPHFALAGFQYLRMLFGANTTKPDVHVMRFVRDRLGRDVSDIEALRLLEAAATEAQLDLRTLDTAIWETAARDG